MTAEIVKFLMIYGRTSSKETATKTPAA